MLSLPKRSSFLVLLLFITSLPLKISPYPAGYRLPFEGRVRITCGPGCGEHKDSASQAIDFQAIDRSPFTVLAISTGTAHQRSQDGNYILIDHGGGRWSFYAHLQSFLVQDGEPVAQGDEVAVTGNTGGGKGNHLHFEVREGVQGSRFFTTGHPVSVIDHPGIDYHPEGPDYQKGYANGEPAAPQPAPPSSSAMMVVKQTNWPVLIEGDALVVEIEIKNIGSETWKLGECYLINKRNAWGANTKLSLTRDVNHGEAVGFSWTTDKFSSWGVHSTEWRLAKGEKEFGDTITINVIVLPKQLADKKKELEEQVRKWAEEQGQNIEKVVIAWIQEQINRALEETSKQICPWPPAAVLPLIVLSVWSRTRRSKKR